MDELNQRRIAHNEAQFRRVNERDVSALDEFQGGLVDSPLSIMCECALTQCQDMVHLDPGTYRRVRAEPTWFIVLPDHVLPSVETIVEDVGEYWIVAKLGAGAVVAREEDDA